MNKKEKMMELLALDKNYIDGEGDYLYYINEEGKSTEVLDLTGSYGVNLLGHKNQVVQQVAEAYPSFPPNFIQASKNPQKELLCDTLTTKIQEHTGKGDWGAELSNTGTEIIELALKMCALHYHRRKEQALQNIRKSENIALSINEDPEVFQKSALQILQAEPQILYIKGSFHGKTLGSLSAMSNSDFRRNIPTAFSGLEVEANADDLILKIDSIRQSYMVYDFKKNVIKDEVWMPIIGIIIEPVQGESGVKILSPELLSQISVVRKTCNIPVISDEIQCGLYRTGHFSALSKQHLVADIYCFGKSLGAGISKISALTYQKSIFTDAIYNYHSSTFSEDFAGCYTANLFFSHLEKPELLENIQSEWLVRQLKLFAESYSEFIKEARGTGYMACIELHPHGINQSFISKFFKDIGKLGYWVSSVLLNREGVRILPSLSGPLSFRIQPSVRFDLSALQKLTKAFTHFFEAIRKHDIQYLFGHIIPLKEGATLKQLPVSVRDEVFPPNAAVFICHPIDLAHLCDIVDLVDGFDEHVLDEILDEVREEQKFTIYHTDTLKSENGELLNIVFLGIPLTSRSFYKALREGKKEIWISKIQDAIDYANANNALSIGLGQFTSIISGNGLSLKSSGAILTSGNTYTAYLAVEALIQAAQETGLNLEHAKISIVGAAGNIASVICQMLASKSAHLNLVYRNNPLICQHTRGKAIEFMQKVQNGNKDSKLKSVLESIDFVDETKFLDNYLLLSNQLTFSGDVRSINGSDIIILSTNEPNKVLDSEFLKPGAIILDIAVPPNAGPEIMNRQDIIYIKGGIAALPQPDAEIQKLESVILPFGAGECFACMAETFGLAIAKKTGSNFIGDISIENVDEISTLMKECGFGLARLKTESSL